MTTESAADAVNALPDSLVASAVEELFQQVFADRPDNELATVKMEGVQELDNIFAKGPEGLEKGLPPKEGIELGRAILSGYATDEALHPLVEQACSKVAEEAATQAPAGMGTLLAAGVVVNLTYLIMTTNVSIQKGKDGKVTWSVSRRAAKPEFVQGVIARLIALVA